MSRSTMEQELEFTDSGKVKIYSILSRLCNDHIVLIILICLASVTKAESIENTENMTMNLTDKLVTNLITVYDIYNNYNGSEYTSRQIEMLRQLKEDLYRHFYEITNLKDPKFDDIIILATSFTYMVYINRPWKRLLEYALINESYITQSMILIKDKELDCKAILIAMANCLEFSYIYLTLNKPKIYLQYAYKIFDIYFAYTKGEDEFPAPIDVLVSLGIGNESNTIMELHTLYLINLRQLFDLRDNYKYRQIDFEKIALYKHKLLKNLMKTVPLYIDHVTWAYEVIHLAEYFMSCDHFNEFKNHLCAASVMMIRFHDEVFMKDNAEISTKNKNLQYDCFKSICSVIEMIWVRYGLVILYLSRKRLQQKGEKNNLCEEDGSKLESITQSNNNSTELLILMDTEEAFKMFTYIDSDNYITNYNDAKILFIRILELLNDIKRDTFASGSVEFRAEIAQYTSRAYKYFASFEQDSIKHIKLQKRRIDVLQDFLKSLYASGITDDYIFIWFELAVVYSTVVDIKIRKLLVDNLTEEELTEINPLVKDSAYYLWLYLSKFEQKNVQAKEYSYQIMPHFSLKHEKGTKYVSFINKYLSQKYV
ncbi:PREDICTED: KIF1-binding protein-like [Dinoponera quadriceps]|uniref:KIF-binding protein n=1 Tax=Dinoponera quadriceps TaxID=609295 RepID=A0A6P3WMI5_DINQU|nr:PREDICTED: KIF1-binding protein-like [Dinoponera quadriceps]